MSFKMERNESDVTVTSGEKTIKMKIPEDRTALSILALNPGADGSRFEKDGWIYVGDKKLRKWFINVDRIKVWEPKLKNILALEKSYTRAHERMCRAWEQEFSPAYDAVKEVGRAHAKPTHKYNLWENHTWWLYKCTDHGDGTHGISLDWVKAPSEPLNHEIGQKYYEMNNRYNSVCIHAAKFREVLERAITNYLNDKEDKKDGRLVDMVLNGRHYIYTCVQERYLLHYKKVAWPKDDYNTLIME